MDYSIKDSFKNFIFSKLHFIQVSELNLSEEAKFEFDELYNQYIVNGSRDPIPYPNSYPISIFLNYLVENKGLLVHGSNHSNIAVFEPREQTLFNGKLVKAVFAASDGIWSLFFAVINKKANNGSLRNMCLTVPTKKGIKRYYYFSLNKDHRGDVWQEGTIYFFSKEQFKQGGIRDEWICEEEIRPLAKLHVKPSDFPFFHKVKRHSEKESNVKTLFKVLIFNK